MKLSEEIRLGSLLVAVPTRNDLRGCAIGMANLSVGVIAVTRDDYDAYNTFYARHPWLVDMKSQCPICYREMCGHEAVWHPFDAHVMAWDLVDGEYLLTPEMTIEQLADFIASVEPPEPVAPQTEGRDPVCTEPAKVAV